SSLSRVESYQYPNAHLGHLSEAQEGALEDFRILCEKEGYYKPAVGHTQASHDDATLLRYLRARKFSPRDALIQFKDTENWRKENHLEDLYNTIDVDEYEDTRKLYPQWTGRRDRRGIPVYLFKVSTLDSKTVSTYEKSISKSITVPHDEKKVPTKMLRLFALYENLMNFVLPLCTMLPDRPNTETPVTQSNNIVDISGVGLKQFWNLKNHMQDASTLATAYYPETLDRIFIIGAPAFFPTVWGWIKRWFDPITVSKIFILSHSNMKSTLEQYIDPENIPKKYGGELDFEFGMMPVLEPAITEHLKWSNPNKQKGQNTIPTGPLKWTDAASSKELELVAVGTNNGIPRKQVVASSSNSGSATPNPAPSQTDTYPPSTLAPTKTDAEASNTHEVANGADTVPAAAPNADPSATIQPVTAGSSGKTGEQPRVGTSETRFEAQNDTHAAGKLEEGTPAVVDHGHGDKTVTMEPMTIGQAPKEKPIPPIQKDQATLLDQAKAAAGAVYDQGVAVAGAVGLVKTEEQLQKEKEEEAKKKEEEEEQHKRDVNDPKVNEASDGKVEGFLRS
ncbi:CRAL/TRIO domain-containing protein, partial [Rhizodiscina lignyota]